MASPMRALRPDYLFSGGRVLSGVSLVVQDGVVQAVGAAPAGAEVVPMRARALLPGMVAAHSHAFQRAIRGRTEHRSLQSDDGSATRAKDDFWSWREAMYAAAERLTPQDLYAVSKFCFLEMARAGITAVGEFHYLHRDPSGKPYADPNELDLAVARAAREAGLRIVLLRVAYARSGFMLPENLRQKRFIEGSAEEYLRNLDALSRHVAVGAAPHSVRACPAEWIRDISREAFRRCCWNGWAPCATPPRRSMPSISASGTSLRWAARAPRSAPAPPPSGTWVTEWCAPICCWRRGYGSASEATRRCSSRRSRTRASSSTTCASCRRRERSSTSSRPVSAVLGPGCTAWPARAACAPWDCPEGRSAPASPRISSPSISTTRPSPARMPTI